MDEARAACEAAPRTGTLLASTCGARRWRTSHGEAIVAPFLLRRLYDSVFSDHSPGAPNSSPESLLSPYRMTHQTQLIGGIQNHRSSAHPDHPRSPQIPRAYSTSSNNCAFWSAVTCDQYQRGRLRNLSSLSSSNSLREGSDTFSLRPTSGTTCFTVVVTAALLMCH